MRFHRIPLISALILAPLVAQDPWPDVAVHADKGALGTEAALVRKDGPTLSWQAGPGAEIVFQPVAEGGAKGLEFFICYDDPRPGKLELIARNAAGEPVGQIDLFPDGRGWRRVMVDLEQDSVGPVSAKDRSPATLHLRVAEGSPSPLYFGKPKWLKTVDWRRTPDPHCPSVYRGKNDDYTAGMKYWLKSYLFTAQAGKGPVTADLDRVARQYEAWVFGSGKDGGATGLAIDEAQDKWMAQAKKDLSALGLRREGRFITAAPGKFPAMNDMVFMLTPLAMDWRKSPDPSKLEAFFLLFDYLVQQGYGPFNSADPSADTTPFARLKLAGYAHAVALMREPLAARGRLDEVRKTLRWRARCGEWDDTGRAEVNADVLRGEAMPRFIYALLAPDPAVRSWELGRFSAWLGDCLTVTSNLKGLIKPDLTVNHHHNPYLVEYGPHALLAAATLATWVEGTPWSLPAEKKDRLEACGDALVDLNRGFSGPIGTRGRFPGASRYMTENLPLYLTLSSKPAFSGRHQSTAKALLEAMGPEAPALLGKKAVRQNLIWMGSKGLADLAATCTGATPQPAPTPSFKAFNWAGVSSVKADGWAAFAQGYSKWIFDFEAGNFPSVENDWGRYLRYGTLELWSGKNPYDDQSSGWTLNNGWDWALIPGATTLLLPAGEISMPKPPAKRIHRSFSDRTFCGGLPGPDGAGVFGLDLHDTAYPGSLEARKSVFIAGDLILCLGSGITAARPNIPVVTTLFQFGTGAGNGSPAPTVDIPVTDPRHPSMTVRDPAGNAFTVLDAGALKRRQGLQQGPAPDGKATSGLYDTLYIDHGASPTGASYAYSIAPAVGDRKARIPAYEILARSGGAHAVRFPQMKATAHVLFEALSRPLGELLAVDRPCLIWVRDLPGGIREISVVDPDLNFPNGTTLDDASDELSKPTEVQVTLAGRWKAVGWDGTPSANGSRTLVSVRCTAGAPQVIRLQQVP